ncbi:hypothetical protein E4K67_07980 [Desulfosporosinus fructosivorans]|uniref:Uncharacterized protein n=1 Tax=Desulfosporosinus fructosivorans TaxID=2018669 RepID=A0A4Z0R951_9FIRM|nr:hypothetical protein [Desulfosporosinus fructosivorans]TGE39360.1 hypothetical protein E4K67_07980 [Desulfosporosinus fructosivorans]
MGPPKGGTNTGLRGEKPHPRHACLGTTMAICGSGLRRIASIDDRKNNIIKLNNGKQLTMSMISETVLSEKMQWISKFMCRSARKTNW